MVVPACSVHWRALYMPPIHLQTCGILDCSCQSTLENLRCVAYQIPANSIALVSAQAAATASTRAEIRHREYEAARAWRYSGDGDAGPVVALSNH